MLLARNDKGRLLPADVGHPGLITPRLCYAALVRQGHPLSQTRHSFDVAHTSATFKRPTHRAHARYAFATPRAAPSGAVGFQEETLIWPLVKALVYRQLATLWSTSKALCAFIPSHCRVSEPAGPPAGMWQPAEAFRGTRCWQPSYVSSHIHASCAGFKSYASRTMIGPLDRFTCVVGPNGCGKSVLVRLRDSQRSMPPGIGKVFIATSGNRIVCCTAEVVGHAQGASCPCLSDAKTWNCWVTHCRVRP